MHRSSFAAGRPARTAERRRRVASGNRAEHPDRGRNRLRRRPARRGARGPDSTVRCLVRDRSRAAGLERGRASSSTSATSPTPTASRVRRGESRSPTTSSTRWPAAAASPSASGSGARNFARMARREGVERVVYLGGLGEREPSPSTCAAATRPRAVLAAEGPPLTYFRAAMVVGAGSESYRTLRYLVGRLPVMIAPSWLRTETQPIGIDATVEYLRRAPEVPESAGREVQIGGPDILSYSRDARPHGGRDGQAAAAQAPGAVHHPVAVGALAGPGDAGRHQRRAAAGRGADHGHGRHRPLGGASRSESSRSPSTRRCGGRSRRKTSAAGPRPARARRPGSRARSSPGSRRRRATRRPSSATSPASPRRSRCGPGP